MTSDPVLDDLLKVCDGRARPADGSDTVGDVLPGYVAAPASTAEVSELLRLAGTHDLRVVARGGGTKLDWGMPPTSVDLVVDMAGLAGVVEHAAGDLVVVARAGTTYRVLQMALADARQQLALDGPFPDATLGGTVATATSGPRRLLYGTMRDLLIGIEFVRADGVVAKAGGKVVKNVAGYDFGKLLTGSYGTLGIVTQVAFRLHPVPSASRFVTVRVRGPDEAGRAVAAVLGSQVAPSAVEVDQPSHGPLTVAVLLEGTADGVEGRAATTAGLVEGATIGAEPPEWFGAYPFGAGRAGLKVTTQISGLPLLLAAVRESAALRGVAVDVRGSAVGVLYAGLPADVPPPAAAALVADMRAVAGRLGGSVVVLTAPGPVRDSLDMWGPVPALDLMRRVKDELDPEHRLSPGRFAGGI